MDLGDTHEVLLEQGLLWLRPLSSPGPTRAADKTLISEFSEVREFLRTGSLPDAIVQNSPLRQSISLARSRARVVPVARIAGRKIRIFLELRGLGIRTSIENIRSLADLANYRVEAGKVVGFELDFAKRCRRLIWANGLNGREDEPISLREYAAAKTRLVEGEVKLVEEFEMDEFVSSLEKDWHDSHGDAPVPVSLQADLYDYQKSALNWVSFCRDNEVGALLALDMGLGKTLVAIAAMVKAREEGGSTHLVICPATLVANWRREIEQFAPSLRVWVHLGGEQLISTGEFSKFDVVITTYETARASSGLLRLVRFDLLILDEAQRVKNPDTATAKSCKEIPARCPLALTGTPFENRPQDIWSIMDFLVPDFLGSAEQFAVNYGNQILDGDAEAIRRLRRRINLFMFRKLKSEVLTELPDEIVRDVWIQMSEVEAMAYNRRLELGGNPLEVITDLRQMCCHPRLASGDRDLTTPAADCRKYEQLESLLSQIRDQGEKALLFAPFLGVLEMLEVDHRSRGLPVFRIDGRVPQAERQLIVDEFSNQLGAALLVANQATASVGLNITSATHVIHYGGVWNPAVEDQANARVNRIGQSSDKIFVHHLRYEKTVDQMMAERVDDKRNLFDELVRPNDPTTTRAITLEELRRYSPTSY